MAVFKCKMCGGAMKIEGQAYGTCPYCGTQQTFPKLDDERRVQMYDRANSFRRMNEFDKALGIYEQILSEEPTDAEAYWSVLLCTYGVVYVEDPRTHKRIPTVNRAQYASIFADKNYLSAIENADEKQKRIYEAEATTIDNIQKGILEVSSKEDPFDVFICYKESDDVTGNRTQDSVYAYELYDALTKEGYRVFFSRVTLENKLGTAFEPYIFAALNSAKVMLVVGTSKDNFNAVWVKNEWARFISLMKTDKSKTLIPVYKDIDPTDLPDDFAYLQAQDMNKIGYIQDIVHGVSKLIQKDEPKAQPIKSQTQSSNVDSLLKRVFMFLEDKDWQSASEYCEKVLDIDPECAEAYLGKLMSGMKFSKKEEIANFSTELDTNAFYQKIVKFGSPELKEELEKYNETIKNRIEENRKASIYENACNNMNVANSEDDFKNSADIFESIMDYKDSASLASECRKKAEEARQEFLKMQEQERLRKEQERLEAERVAEERRKKVKIVLAILLVIILVIVAICCVVNSIKNKQIKQMHNPNGKNVGDTLLFGTYQGEDIEWQVLAKEENKILVISKYALEYKDYNETLIDITWEECTLRSYLNNDFYYSAFSDNEKSKIAITKVVNNDNSEYDTEGGNDTEDKIFLLSIDEANKYFSNDDERISDSCWWWLRSPGRNQSFVAQVDNDGRVQNYGGSVAHVISGVRPALWIKY